MKSEMHPAYVGNCAPKDHQHEWIGRATTVAKPKSESTKTRRANHNLNDFERHVKITLLLIVLFVGLGYRVIIQWRNSNE